MSFRKCLRDDVTHRPPGNLKKIKKKKKKLDRCKPHHAHTTAKNLFFLRVHMLLMSETFSFNLNKLYLIILLYITILLTNYF